jgi:glycosyltransferase involved in cell wall biosynthesis
MASEHIRIGVIYGGISEQKAGMDHYLHQVLSAMKPLAPQYRFTLIDHRTQSSPFKEQFETLVLELPQGPLKVSRWNLQVVPRVLSRFDLVFSPGLYGPVRIPPGVASVMVVHDLTRYLFPDFFQFNPVQKILDRLVYPAMLRRYDHLLAVSQSTCHDLKRLFKLDDGKKISVAYHGAESNLEPLDKEEAKRVVLEKYGLKTPFILFLGTLEPRKNIPTLLKAFAQIREQIPHDLVLVGQRGWKWEPIFQAIQDLNIDSRVHWVGYVPDQERALFYNAADFLVYPSWYEGFGMPLLEAMQCGCPVITSKVSAMPEVVGASGMLIDPAQVGTLQEAMLRMAGEPELREKLRKAGLVRASNFSWEASARLTLEVFEKVIRSKVRSI